MSYVIDNKEERMVYEYLLSQGYEDIQYEPNRRGNNKKIPPDFSIKVGSE
jgi:hypothetical protein